MPGDNEKGEEMRPKTMRDRERAEELAHGGLVSRNGNMVTLGDGSQWWLNGMEWARREADGLIAHDRWAMEW